MGDVNVVDLTSPQTVVQPNEDVYAHPVSIPYLFTTARNTRPTTMLLFTTPQRVPPLRPFVMFASNLALPFSYRDSRSSAGAWVDGLLLRAADPSDAAARLVMAGAREVNDPVAWLRAHREVVTDPAQAAAVISSTERTIRTGRIRSVAVTLLLLTLFAARWVLDHDAPTWLWPVLVVTGVSSVVLWLIAPRAARSTVPPAGMSLTGDHRP
jgi:hypothetical protein